MAHASRLVALLLLAVPATLGQAIDQKTGLWSSASLTQQAKDADLFPLSEYDESVLLANGCGGKVHNSNFHPCPVKKACFDCGQNCKLAAYPKGYLASETVAATAGCGAAVIIKFAQGDINSCNTGLGFGSAQGNTASSGNSQSTYYCAAQAATAKQCCSLCDASQNADGADIGFKCKSFVLVAPNFDGENPKCNSTESPKGVKFIDQQGENPSVVTPYWGGCGWCYLLPERYCAPTCSSWGLYKDNADSKNNIYWALRGRSGCADVKNDPHFSGADGTRYEFNGLPGKSFCLLSDKDLHINMKMHGYLDERTIGATILKDGKAVRTWMRELGFVWNKEGQRHTLHLVARAGKSQEYGEGFLAKAEVDGVALPKLTPGEALSFEGGLTVTFIGPEKQGPYDMDKYEVSIDGLISVVIKMRLAHPLLQQPDDAEAHFNIMLSSVVPSDSIHGVIGQTYRSGRTIRALEYRALSALMGHPVAADQPGMGYLDGVTADYISSDILAPDCKYSAFH